MITIDYMELEKIVARDGEAKLLVSSLKNRRSSRREIEKILAKTNYEIVEYHSRISEIDKSAKIETFIIKLAREEAKDR